MTKLVPGTDALFAWMLGGARPPLSLKLPPGGVAEPAILELLRGAAARVRAVLCWRLP